MNISLYLPWTAHRSNSGASRVNLATLKAIEGNSTTLVDGENCCLLSRHQGSSSDVTVLEKDGGVLITYLYECKQKSYSNDLLIRGEDIFI